MNPGANTNPAKIRKMVARYNMIANLFWSVLNLTPVFLFCYRLVNLKLLSLFLIIPLLTIFLPKSFFDTIQLGSGTSIYKKLGVHFINRFTQNGTIINGLIRKKFAGYRVVRNNRSSIKMLLNQTYIFEKFHFTLFIFFTQAAIYALMQTLLMWAIIILVTNIVYNVYPVFLQQFIRVKLLSVIKK